MSKDKAIVGIVMGSATDAEVMQECANTLKSFGIGYEMRVLSAHRTPEEACMWAASASDRGLKVIIAAAGVAAHLAGVVAAHTSLPVLGVPMPGGALNGFDALLSTVQMPKGTPVATLAIGKAGAVNAALFAVRILGLSSADLEKQILKHKEQLRDEVLAADAKLAG